MFIRSQNLNKFEKNSIEEYNHKNENSSVILRLVNSNSERISFHKHGNQQCKKENMHITLRFHLK
jgi:hypothetical protein